MRESATSAKNKFGNLIDNAMSEPVFIEKKGRPVVVVLSVMEYQRLIDIEDRYWGEKAVNAAKEGFLSAEESQKWLEGKFRVEAPVE
jgi:prevent-host-death family protein